MSTVIKVENVSKLYRLGEVGTGSLAHDVNRWWHKMRGNEDPYLKIGQVNDRTKAGKKETGDRRRETGDGKQETGDGKQETGDGRRETWDGKQPPRTTLHLHCPLIPVPCPLLHLHFLLIPVPCPLLHLPRPPSPAPCLLIFPLPTTFTR